MKKSIIALLVLALLLPLSLSATEKSGEQWNLHLGSAIYVSQIGVSRDVGQWEFGLNVDSGFPNVVIFRMMDEPDEGQTKSQQFWEAVKGSLTLAYGGDIYAKFDVIPSDTIDLDFSLGIAGIYANLTGLAKIAAGFAEAGMRFTWNINEHNGLYFETNVPLYTLLVTKDTSGEVNTHGTFLFSGDDGLATLFTITGLFCTRIGYRVSF